MSHFSVAVIVDNDSMDLLGVYRAIDNLLAPYEETYNANSEYTEFIDRTEVVCDKAVESGMDEESCACYYGYKRNGDMWGYWANPNAKWDWWSFVGRFSDVEWNGADIADWEPFAVCQEDYREAYEAYEEGLKNGFDGWFMTPEYLIDRYCSDPVLYARTQAIDIPYAVVSPTGEWIAPGEVGWFGYSDDTAESQSEYETRVKSLMDSIGTEHGKYTVILVDCHI